MRTSTVSSRMQRIVLFVVSLCAAAPGSATEPLLDMYSDGGRTGRIFPPACCYVKLPDNKRIWEMRKRDMQKCSAIGGPVGMFKREGGKLWLTGLFKCGGEVALQEVYPDMTSPVVADWLTGTFETKIDWQCAAAGHHVYAVTQQLIVEKGVVRSFTETRNDTTPCVN